MLVDVSVTLLDPDSRKSFLLVIRHLNLDDLAQQIETYLSGGIVKEPFEIRENEAVVVGGERVF